MPRPQPRSVAARGEGLTLKEAESTSGADLGNTRSSRSTQLDSVISQAEQLRDQPVEQEYNDRFGVYVQEKAEQINRLESDLAEAIASEQRELEVIPNQARLECQQASANSMATTHRSAPGASSSVYGTIGEGGGNQRGRRHLRGDQGPGACRTQTALRQT